MSETYEDTAAPADEAGPFDDVAEAAEALAEDAAELAEDVAELADGPEPVESEEGTPADPDTKGEKRSRAAPTDLQGDMKRITDLFVTGDEDLLARLDGKPLTPSRVAVEVAILRGDPDKVPSTGAVAAAFQRWADYGFAAFSEKPFAFADYTERGREIGLKGILAERKASRVGSVPVDEPEAPVEAPVEAPAPTEPPF